MVCHPQAHVKVYFFLCKNLAKAFLLSLSPLAEKLQLFPLFLQTKHITLMIMISTVPGNTPTGPTIFPEGKSWHGMALGTDRRMISTVLQAIAQLIQPRCWKQHKHVYSHLVHSVLCKYWLALLWKGSRSQTELSAFPCFSLFFFFLAARHFLFFPNLLDSHHHRRYFKSYLVLKTNPLCLKMHSTCTGKDKGR